jgi:hypothetical protein
MGIPPEQDPDKEQENTSIRRNDGPKAAGVNPSCAACFADCTAATVESKSADAIA